MKKVVFIILMALTSNAFSQEMKLDTIKNRYCFCEIVKADGITKNELFSNAMQWFAETFGDVNKVIQLKDEVNGKIIANSNCEIGKFHTNYDFKIFISVKDNKYKYSFTDFVYKSEDGTRTILFENTNPKMIIPNLTDFFKPIIEGFNKKMTEKQSEENW